MQLRELNYLGAMLVFMDFSYLGAAAVPNLNRHQAYSVVRLFLSDIKICLMT